MSSGSGDGPEGDRDLPERAEWQFDFVLQSEDGASLVPRERCEELLDLIIDWVEGNRLAIGGGCGPCTYEDGR